MSSQHCDVLIIGGGIVGLCIAHQLLERQITRSITIIDKEPELGRHSSGRNSGVLHAGLYYKPESLKAQVCVAGARRLRGWVEERGLPINPCGKVIVPPRAELDGQLELLAERGRANGATVEFLEEQQLHKLIPEALSASGRALWSPNTVVVNPSRWCNGCNRSCSSRGSGSLQQLQAGGFSRKSAASALPMTASSHTAISTTALGSRPTGWLISMELGSTTACCLSRVCIGNSSQAV